jgi:hypothetical protein
MNSQIFKTPIDKEIFFEFLSTCSKKKLKHYEISKTSFKSAVFQNLIQPFCDSIKEYYHISKRHYITRKMTYKNLITVVRQICKYHHIAFTSQIKYDNSNYEISYSIFFDSAQ